MRLPVLSGRDVIRGLEVLGFRMHRQRGSHVSMVRQAPFAATSVPMHAEIKPGTLLGILRRAGISRDEFLGALED